MLLALQLWFSLQPVPLPCSLGAAGDPKTRVPGRSDELSAPKLVRRIREYFEKLFEKRIPIGRDRSRGPVYMFMHRCTYPTSY